MSDKDKYSNDSYCPKCLIDIFNRTPLSYSPRRSYCFCQRREVSKRSPARNECVLDRRDLQMCGHERGKQRQSPIRHKFIKNQPPRPISPNCYHSPVRRSPTRSEYQTIATNEYSELPLPSESCEYRCYRCKYQRNISPCRSNTPPCMKRHVYSSPIRTGSPRRDFHCFRPVQHYELIKCGHCDQPVYFNERVFSLQHPWHISCLICVVCGKKLSPGKHAVTGGLPICHFPCMSAYLSGYQYGSGSKDAKP